MFSGIIEAKSSLISFLPREDVYELKLQKPSQFDDISLGDSIAVDGVCLTVEEADKKSLTFAVAPETLKITKWNKGETIGREMNLERSLQFGARLHGHLVTGHVDAMGKVVDISHGSETSDLTVQVPSHIRTFVWNKGSIAINGVSLTVNSVSKNKMNFCIIPETLKRTNLSSLVKGDVVCVEADLVSRALVNYVTRLNVKEMLQSLLASQARNSVDRLRSTLTQSISKIRPRKGDPVEYN